MKNNYRNPFLLTAAATLALFGSQTNSLQAASATWSLFTGSGNWATGTNWGTSAAPGATSGTTNTDKATFPNTSVGSAGTITVTVDAGRNIKDIHFSATNNSTINLSGGSLVITDGGSILKDGSGNKNSTVGTPISLAGDVTFTASSSNNASNLLFSAGGTVTGSSTKDSLITLNGSNTGDNNFTGVIANGAGQITSVTKSGNGTWNLLGANTYTGDTTVSAGTLAINSAGRIADTSNLVVNGGIFNLKTFNETVGAVTISSGSINGTGTLTGSSYALQGGNVNALLGTGAITVSTGTTILGSAGRLNSASTLAVNSGQLTLGGDETVAGYTQTGGTLGAPASVNTLTSTSAFNMQAGSVNAKLGGNVGLNKTTGGTTTLSGANSYTGATTINGGELKVDGSTSASSAVTVNNAAILRGTGTVGGTVTLNGTSSLQSTGTLTLSNSLTVAGTNSITSGTVSVAGTTNIGAGGALAVNGTLSGSGGVTLDGTLSGTGTVNKTITLNSGATLAPGNSIGAVNTSTQVWNGGGNFDLEFKTDGTGMAGSDWDQANITGSLDLTGVTSGNQFTIKLFTMSNATNQGLLSVWDADVNHTWASFVTTSGGIIGFTGSDQFTVDTTDFQNTLNGSFTVVVNGNNLDLNYTAIPEPAAALLGSLGMLVLLRRRRA